MACDCSVCKNRYIKEGAVTPVAMICDLTANDCKSVLILLNACDDNGRFLRSVMLNCDGTATLVGTFDLSLNPYTPVGVVNDCEEKDFEYLCDDTANVFVSLLDVTVTPHELKYYLPLPNGDLAPYTPTGTVRICGNPDYEVTTACYIDTTTDQEINRIQFWDTTEVPPVLVSTIWYNVSTGATIAAPTLTNLIPCSTSLMPQEIVLCDDNGSFVRHFVYNPDGTINRTYDTSLQGISYTPAGNVVDCNVTALPPQKFCFTTTVTTPQNFLGRSFTGHLEIARGYTVKSIIIDGVTYPVNITWSVLDTTGVPFATALENALSSKLDGITVDITPTGIDICSVVPQSFAINITCVERIKAHVSIAIIYDGGSDLIQNASFASDPPVTVFNQARRMDNGGALICTNVPNRGWETNDPNGAFEQWPAGFLGITPTPRGTSIQEVNAFAANTLWQTMDVPIAGTYKLKATIGGRDDTENFIIKLSTGDTDATGLGDIINATIPATSVTGGTGAPWTVYETEVTLTAGVYTLSLKGPDSGSAGGLFTDLQFYTTLDNTRLNLTADDTCMASVDVTTETVDCQYWQPSLDTSGIIIAWNNPKLGTTLTNAAFWAQVPPPECCVGASTAIDKEQEVLCDDNGPFIRHYLYNPDGTLNTAYDTKLNGITYATVGLVDICVKSSVPFIVCRCDDTDGDNIPDKTYKAIVQIDDVGATIVLANYEEDLLTSYTPIAPMSCSDTGTELISVLPNYTVLQGAGTWILHTDSAVLTQSVTVTVITVGNMADPPTLTTQAGVHPVYEGQTITWSAVFQRDILGLKSPLTITSKAGDIIAIHWTEESI